MGPENSIRVCLLLTAADNIDLGNFTASAELRHKLECGLALRLWHCCVKQASSPNLKSLVEGLAQLRRDGRQCGARGAELQHDHLRLGANWQLPRLEDVFSCDAACRSGAETPCWSLAPQIGLAFVGWNRLAARGVWGDRLVCPQRHGKSMCPETRQVCQWAGDTAQPAAVFAAAK